MLITLDDTSISVGGTTQVRFLLTSAPHGFSGFTIDVTITGGAAHADSISLMAFGLDLTLPPTFPSTSFRVLAADVNRILEVGATNRELLVLTIEGLSSGTATITPVLLAMDNDDGNPVNPAVSPASLQLTVN